MSIERTPFLAAASFAVAAAMASPSSAAVDAREPGAFVESLAETAFASLRGRNPAAARGQFRSILAQHFDVGGIGDRLIQRHRARITPEQYARYKAAFPGFIINTYGARLQPYSDADLRVLRVVPRGASAVVSTSVTRPGARPATPTWTVTRIGTAYKVTNLTVGGVNLGLAQQADFDSYIQQKGFDALVAFMRSRA